MNRDETDCKQPEDATRVSEERYRSLFENNPHPMWVYDLETLAFLEVNDAAIAHYGYSRQEFLAMTIKDIHPPEVQLDLLAAVRGIPGSFRRPGVWPECKKDGTVIDVEIVTHDMLFEGRAARLVLADDITERKRAEEALRESERRLTEAQRIGRIGDWEWIPAENKVIWSAEMYAIFGIAETVSLTTEMTIQAFHPKDRAMVAEATRKTLEELKPQPIECRILKPDGTIGYVYGRGEVVLDANGKLVKMIGIYQDITERKRAEEALRESENKYRALFSEMLNGCALHEIICDDDGNTVDYVTLEVNSAFERLLNAKSANVIGKRASAILPKEELTKWLGIFGPVALTGESIRYEMYSDLNQRHFEGTAYCPEKGKFAVTFSDITERKRMEAALRASQGRYRRIVETAREGIWIIDAGAKTTFVNQRMADMLGYTIGEMLYAPIHAFMDEQDYALVADLLERRRQGISEQHEFRFRRQDGADLWAILEASPILDEHGKFAGTLAMVTDITARRRAEEQIRFLSAIAEQTTDSILVTDTDYRIIYANEAAQRLFGYTVEELAGQKPDILNAEPEAQSIQERIYSDVASGNSYLDTCLNRRKDGSTFICEFKVTPMRDADGRTCAYIGVQRDITERKRAEEALRESEEKFRAIADYTADVEAWFGVNGRLLWINPSVERTMGYTPAECLSMPDFPLPLIHPKDTARVAGELGEAQRGGRDDNKEFRFVCKDGTVRWGSVSWQPIFDRRGQPLGRRSSIRDITERKRAEESLRKLSRAVEQSPALILITDPNWVFEYVNPKFTQVTGYALEQVIGKTTSILQSGKTPPETYRQLQDTLAGGGEWRGEFCNKKKNGELYWESASISPLVNEDGVVTHFVAVKEDITGRKRAEEALRRSQQLLDKTFVSLHDAVFIIDADTVEIIECNPAASKIFGYGRQEMLGRTTAFLHVDEAELDEFRSHLSSAVKERGFLDHLEFRMKRKNGSVFPTEHSVTPFEDEQGRCIGWVSVVRDITGRKRAEEAQRESEKRYHIVSELTSDFAGAFRIALDGTIMREWLTGAYSRITGFNPGEMDTHGIWVTLVHPEDMRVALRHLQTLLSGQSDVCELRIVTASGEVRWLSNYGRPVWDEAQGRVIRIYSASQDITERKRAEEALRESEARFRSYFELPLVGIAITSPEKGWIEVNHQICSMLGYSREELLRMTWSELTHPEDLAADVEQFNRILAGQIDSYSMDKRFIRKNGEVIWTSIAVGCVRDSGGKVQHIIALALDITERKQAEERARREAARAKALARVAARLNAQLDLDTVLSAVCEETAHALGVPVASVMLYEPDRQVFRLAGIYGLPPQVCEQFTPVPQSLYKEYREQKGSLIVTPDLQPSRPNVELYARHDIRTTVAASMVREEKLVGALNVHTVGDVRTFADDELALLKGLADQAAQAIANAQLFEQVKQQREQLRTLTARLAETGEEQRRQLARELHDRVGQSLTALSINLNIIRSQLPADSPQATARLDDSLRLVEETVEHTRDVMAELHPPVLDDYGLLAALRWYAERFSGSAIVDTLVEGEELDPRLPQAVEASLFRIAQEALNNVTKHAHATQASVRLEAVADMAHLTIADDGVGFDPTAKRQPGELPYWGLITMKERAEAVGGRLRVESAPGQGTHIMVKVPR